MDVKELTHLFLQRRELADQLADIDEVIKGHILELEESFEAAGVKATYYQPTKTYDYKAAAEGHPMVSDTTISLFTKTKEYTSWKDICEHAGIDDIPFEEKPPRVVIK